MTETAWWESYLDIPFRDGGRDRAGCDCWGLVRLVWAEQRGRELPAWDAYGTVRDRAAIAPLLSAALPVFEPLAEPRPFSIALFRSAVSVFHVGVMVDESRMLDIETAAGVWVRPWTAAAGQFAGWYWPQEAPHVPI